jgi:mRNA-degrading endonuclease RelE of RelBE toxin-antitoxin system
MSYKIITSSSFNKELKSLVKKYPSLKEEYRTLYQSLENDAAQGTSIGKNCYKIRLAIRSKNVGKSGGARVITHVKIIKQTVYLLSIYDKSEQSSIGDKEIAERIKGIK